MAVLALTMPAAWLGGCSGSSGPDLSFTKDKPAQQAEQNAFPTDYKQEMASFLRRYIDNPQKVRDAYIATPVLRPVAGQPRYVTCIRYNPRDFENKYLGNTEKLAIYLGGKMNQLLESDPQICPGLAYQRYPEIENMVP